MKQNSALFLLLLSCLVSAPARADLIFNVFEIGGNVRLEYSGTLDMTGVSFSDGNLALEEHALRVVSPPFGAQYNALVQLIDAPSPRADLRTFQNAFSSAPALYYSGNALIASSFGGNAFHLPTASIGPNATLRFDPLDLSGNVWSGSGFMQWNNTSFAAWGIDTSTKTWVINNAAANTITMTFNASAVPEPGSVLLVAGGLGLIAYRRRNRRDSH